MLLLMSALCASVVIQYGNAQVPGQAFDLIKQIVAIKPIGLPVFKPIPEEPPYEVLSTDLGGVCIVIELILIILTDLHLRFSSDE